MTDTAVYLARHGQTALNADGRLRGLADPPLDEVGRAEARRLAALLAAKHPAVVISSPLRRAVATAEEIADASNTAALVDDRLSDRDYGPWTGAVKADVIDEFGSVDAAPGVESATALSDRVLTAFRALVAEADTWPVVLVSHDAVNRALRACLDPNLTDIGQRTACWNQLTHRDGAWHVDFEDRLIAVVEMTVPQPDRLHTVDEIQRNT
ncbi:histidine phosphatase family protein [Rhodococcus opacus]|uniref:histidine phosphatase family protein n=1 Tax=Rhodococcus opacus TaxID=37919 RepID=UPI0007CD945F|nr:histidine phosphatase family protein [Rhodococcus opacus]MDX5962483.1 histidine phosphatase family protein [Rhodococcus opacus]CAG7640221.1 2,3-bisphosphoglycerate-dependent phosphoglycerate mutase [Rhodococcus opacus]